MSNRHVFLVLSVAAVLLIGCSDDAISPPDELAPPTALTLVTGTDQVMLDWAASTSSGAGDFAGYNVYADTISIADSTDVAFLNARKVNGVPQADTEYTIQGLTQGTMYYFHVRSVDTGGKLSEASTELDTAPRPEGTTGTDGIHDFDAGTTTESGYGFDRATGAGMRYTTGPGNAEEIDFFMMEDASSMTASNLVSPSVVDHTVGWPQRNLTLFRDLGAGEAAWNTSVAPDSASMTTTVRVELDHTYAVRTHDLHWLKVRVTTFVEDQVQGKTLNYAEFSHAFQLINDYGRFKPLPVGVE